MSNTQLLNQFDLTLFTVKDPDFGSEHIAKSNAYPLLAHILNFLPHIDEVESMQDEINNVITEGNYEDISVLFTHIRILPDEIRIYDEDNNNYEQPNIVMTPNDFKAVLNEWKIYLQKNP